MRDLHIAVICSSNINRSMEAHAYLMKQGFRVKSFGTGDMVRLPGESPDRPNCYKFGTPYSEIYQDLVKKDHEYYTQNGLLGLIERNKRVKLCPERLQDSTEMFDLIITCEESVFDQVIVWFMKKPTIHKKVDIVNVDIEDNPEEATIGSFLISDLVTKISQTDDDIELDWEKLLLEFNVRYEKSMAHCTMSY